MVWELLCPGKGCPDEQIRAINVISPSLFWCLLGRGEALWTFLPFDLTAFEAQVQPCETTSAQLLAKQDVPGVSRALC